MFEYVRDNKNPYKIYGYMKSPNKYRKFYREIEKWIDRSNNKPYKLNPELIYPNVSYYTMSVDDHDKYWVSFDTNKYYKDNVQKINQNLVEEYKENFVNMELEIGNPKDKNDLNEFFIVGELRQDTLLYSHLRKSL